MLADASYHHSNEQHKYHKKRHGHHTGGCLEELQAKEASGVSSLVQVMGKISRSGLQNAGTELFAMIACDFRVLPESVHERLLNLHGRKQSKDSRV